MLRIYLFTILFFIGAVCFGQPYEKQVPPKNPIVSYKAKPKPDRILMTATDPLLQTRTLTWRTGNGIKEGIIEWSEQQQEMEFYRDVESTSAQTKVFVTLLGDTVYYHTATLDKLVPGKKYTFRVGYEDYWSEWIDFSLPSDDFSFRFIYLGDAQNDVFSLWSRVFRKANHVAASADFVLHAGDLINHSRNEHEWAEWFEAGDYLMASKPQFAVPGNHEYVKDDDGEKQGLTPSWSLQFKYPQNGQEEVKHSSYFFDYKNCRFVFLNTNEALKEQGEWLESILKENKQKWTIVMFHHPVIAATKDRENTGLIKYWKPVLERYKVDLVLQGHDHAYGRGRIPDIDGNRTGPVYVVSVAGRKSYELGNFSWMEVKAQDTQTFQVIDVTDNAIDYKAYTLDDQLLDSFSIVKHDNQPVQSDK